MRNSFKKFLGPLIILLCSFILFLTNYKPGAFLIGWDNIMPEFNIGLNLKRQLSGVWQDYRGLGLYDGMAHNTNIIHTLFIGFLSIFLLSNIIRYVSIIFLHFIGGLGMFGLLGFLEISAPFSFLAALFYMFNLGTIQQFFAPLEVFAFHFAGLPWLFWSGLKFIKSKDRKSLLFFFFTSILFTPQSFVPTFFVVLMMAYLVFAIYDISFNKTIKNYLIILVVTLIVNSFWLVPYIVGLPKNTAIIRNARINQFSSEEVYLRNKARGDLISVFGLKGFMIDSFETDSAKNFYGKFMVGWVDYIQKNPYKVAYLLAFAVMLFGIYKSITDKKIRPFLILFFIGILFLANDTFLISQTNEFIRNFIPVLGEAFRFPFTKLITLFLFSLTIFFAYGLQQLVQKINKRVLIIIYLFCLLILSLPAFQGNFFSPLLKRKVPSEYFQVIDYFKRQDKNKRIALLPIHTFWSWQYRNWGHVGSGFLWYGIPQPILERAFDPWSDKNEQFYNEISYAFKTENIDLLNQVIKKYDIGYFLLDQYFVNNLSPKPINYKAITNFLSQSLALHKEAQFGKLIVYKTNLPTQKNKYFIIDKAVKAIKPADFYYQDTVFNQSGNYIIDNKNPDIISPFMGLFTGKLQDNFEFRIILDQQSITITPKNNLFADFIGRKQYILSFPNILSSYLIPVKISLESKEIVFEIIYPQIFVNKQLINIPSQKIKVGLTKNSKPIKFELTESKQIFKNNDLVFLVRDLPNTLKIFYGETQFDLINVDLRNEVINPINKIKVYLDKNSQLKVTIPVIKSTFFIEKTINSVKKEAFYKEDLPHQTGYIIFADSSWISGLPVDFYIDNPFSARSELDGKISKKKNFTNVFILPPTQKYFSGYGFHFDPISVGSQIAKTDIKKVAVYPFPYEFLNEITLTKEEKTNHETDVLVYPQSFHPGWIAWADGKLLKHVTVNNWANGWTIPENQQIKDIIIIFWPQYLEFVGFLLLIITLFIVVLAHKKAENSTS